MPRRFVFSLTFLTICSSSHVSSTTNLKKFSNNILIKTWEIKNIHDDDTNNSNWLSTSIPSTVLHTLIENGILLQHVPTLTTVQEKPYFKNALSTVPDIHVTGPDYYTYYWRPRSDLGVDNYSKKNHDDPQPTSFLIPLPHPDHNNLRFHFLRFYGISFRSELFFYYNYHNDHIRMGKRKKIGESLGMWQRHTFEITNYTTPSLVMNDGIQYLNLSNFHLLVYPPTHYGIPTSFCPEITTTNISSTPSCGQGGNHQLAKDAGAMQFAAGWDWIQGNPDRLTGVFDKVEFISTGAIQISDSFIETVHINTTNDVNNQQYYNSKKFMEKQRADAILKIETRITNREEYQSSEGCLSVIITSMVDKSKIVLDLRQNVKLQGGESQVVMFKNITLLQARLWWNWQYGPSSLYDAEFIVTEKIIHEGRGLQPKFVFSDRERIQFGIRTTSSYVDENTGGRAFSINNIPIFLQGGNFIATDMMLRFSNDPSRYSSEVFFHKMAGLNILRVWGGGIAERTEFYNACDRLGMLVYQEFWMTGDNNGRWGGEYSFPLNYDSYLDQARDTIKMIRSHPSLLFYGGGNELFPQSSSPPPYIARGLKHIVRVLDQSRLLILSSMDGGQDGSNMSQHNSSFALAVKDGPYNFLPCSSYYSDNNPGLINGNSIIISFQPEIGSSSTPRFLSLKRMGLADDPLSFPSKCDSEIPELFVYHKYQGYCMTDSANDEDYDAVYAYGSPRSLKEWTVRAQLAAYQQYQCLFEGFTSKMFAAKENGGKSAIIMWKTQSPWPSLRGFLYDWFLDATGTFYGVLTGTGGMSTVLHPQLDLSNLQPQLVNRGRFTLHRDSSGMLMVDFFTKEGKRVGNTWNETVSSVPPLTVFRAKSCASWPDGFEHDTLFVRVSLTSSEAELKPTWYWLRDPELGPFYDFTDLGVWRDGGAAFPAVKADVTVWPLGSIHEEYELQEEYWRAIVTISVASHSKAIVFQPFLTFFHEGIEIGNSDDDTVYNYDRRVLPYFSEDIPPVLLPGEQAIVHVYIPKTIVTKLEDKGRRIQSLQIEFWAGTDIVVPVQYGTTKSELREVKRNEHKENYQ